MLYFVFNARRVGSVGVFLVPVDFRRSFCLRARFRRRRKAWKVCACRGTPAEVQTLARPLLIARRFFFFPFKTRKRIFVIYYFEVFVICYLSVL